MKRWNIGLALLAHAGSPTSSSGITVAGLVLRFDGGHTSSSAVAGATNTPLLTPQAAR